MEENEEKTTQRHLTDGELFTLAMPPAGEPEALPRHLSDCLTCSRSFSEWRVAVAELAREDAAAVTERPAGEWETLEAKTLSAIRRSRVGRRSISWGWMTAIAASLLVCGLAVPLALRSSRPASDSRAMAPTATSAELTGQDQEDDALLRDVARLTRGDEESRGLWNSLAPDPESGQKTGERS